MKKSAVIILLIIIGLGTYFFTKNNSNKASREQTERNITETSPQPLPSVDASDLRAGGSSYREESGAYNFLYPPDYVLDETDKQHIRIYKTGPTQQGQTEMYDGALLVFEVVTMGEKSLSEWVDINIETITADGTSEVTEPKKEIALQQYQGFTYSTRGLGESKNYIFQKDNDSDYAVLVSTAVYDPSNVGFQQEVDKIISTLEIEK